MSFNLNNINLNDVHTEERPTILNAGKYDVTIQSAKYEQNSKKTGWNLVLEYKDTKSSGTIRSWTTVQHSSTEAQRIGLEHLKQALTNMGWEKENPPEADWFKGKSIGINVVDEEGSDGMIRSKVSYTYKSAASPKPEQDAHDDAIPF
jgi:hypothetical protein